MRAFKAVLLALLLAFGSAGSASAQYVMDIGSLIFALQMGDFGDIAQAVPDANTVYVERISRLAGARVSAPTLNRTIAERARVLVHVRAIVRQSPEAMKALKRHGQTLDQVIFVTYTNDRTATLYVDDR